MAHVSAVCVVHELHSDAGIMGVTAIDKRPVTGPVHVGRWGLRGDVQADRPNHGGLEKAVYLYSQEDADYWSDELGRELPGGWFGENLRIDGLAVNTARVGELLRIGDGDDAVEIELTMPRTPCQTFARWVGGDDERGWVKRFAQARRLGAYARVVRTGTIVAGANVTVLSVPDDAYPGEAQTPAAQTIAGMFRFP